MHHLYAHKTYPFSKESERITYKDRKPLFYMVIKLNKKVGKHIALGRTSLTI